LCHQIPGFEKRIGDVARKFLGLGWRELRQFRNARRMTNIGERTMQRMVLVAGLFSIEPIPGGSEPPQALGARNSIV